MEREKNRCRAWYEGDPILEEYHDNEWCKVNHDDNFQFEMLCLEGASVGLSWKTICIREQIIVMHSMIFKSMHAVK